MRTAEEWGRVAVSLPGWRVLRGIRWRGENGVPMGSEWQPWPDPDDPAKFILPFPWDPKRYDAIPADWEGEAPEPRFFYFVVTIKGTFDVNPPEKFGKGLAEEW